MVPFNSIAFIYGHMILHEWFQIKLTMKAAEHGLLGDDVAAGMAVSSSTTTSSATVSEWLIVNDPCAAALYSD